MTKYRRQLAALATGSTTFAIGTAFANVDFAQILTNFISLLLSAIVSLFLGQQPMTA
jgi:hypothetical protein